MARTTRGAVPGGPAQPVRVSVLGRFSLVVGGKELRLAARDQALIALLAVRGGQVVDVDRLADLLWDGTPPVAASAAIRNAVCRTRREVTRAGGDAHALLGTDGHGYRLGVPPGCVDVAVFERHATEAVSALARGEPGAARSAATDALALWTGEDSTVLSALPAAQPELHYLRELRLAALETRVECDLLAGRHALVVGELEALVVRHPLWEAAWGQLMRALAGCGRPADALQAYRRLHLMLREEWGLDPSPPLRRLQERILLQDPSIDGCGPGPWGTDARFGVLPAGATVTAVLAGGAVTCTA